MARSADANVTPCLVSTWIWVRPGSSYSTGSSTVMMFTSSVAISRSAAYMVVVLPEPVGPVTTKIPSRFPRTWRIRSTSGRGIPVSSRVPDWRGLSTRTTTFSARRVGTVEIRRSNFLPSTTIRARPSWGRSRSAMSRRLMTLMRDTTRVRTGPGICMPERRTPSTRYRTTPPVAVGWMWMSLAPRSMASRKMRLVRRTTGPEADSSMVTSSGSSVTPSTSTRSSTDSLTPSRSVSAALSGE